MHVIPYSVEKSNNCDHCKKYDINRCVFKMHVIPHSGEKSNNCDHCKKYYMKKCVFRMHVIQHSGEKSNNCDHWKKYFMKGCILKMLSVLVLHIKSLLGTPLNARHFFIESLSFFSRTLKMALGTKITRWSLRVRVPPFRRCLAETNTLTQLYI